MTVFLPHEISRRIDANTRRELVTCVPRAIDIRNHSLKQWFVNMRDCQQDIPYLLKFKRTETVTLYSM